MQQFPLPIEGHDLRILRRPCRESPEGRPGVANAVVNLATERPCITTNDTVDRITLVKAVENAGYEVPASFSAPAALAQKCRSKA